jgi:hypothetical protein
VLAAEIATNAPTEASDTNPRSRVEYRWSAHGIVVRARLYRRTRIGMTQNWPSLWGPSAPSVAGVWRRLQPPLAHTFEICMPLAIERPIMNTRMRYRYADKRNCKQFTVIVVAGTITWEQIAPYLAMQQSFIPGQVGLEDLQHRFALPGADHPWHQIASEDITPTAAEPTVALSGEDLAWRFAHTAWDASLKPLPASFKATTSESKPPARSPSESLHSIQHVYAHGKQSPEVGAPARQRSARAK